MTKDKGFTPADLAAVSDSPEITAEEFAKARPARDVLPAEFFQEVARRRRGPQQARPVKKLVSLRLDPEVLEQWKASGPGWQGRMNDALRAAAPHPHKA